MIAAQGEARTAVWEASTAEFFILRCLAVAETGSDRSSYSTGLKLNLMDSTHHLPIQKHNSFELSGMSPSLRKRQNRLFCPASESEDTGRLYARAPPLIPMQPHPRHPCTLSCRFRLLLFACLCVCLPAVPLPSTDNSWNAKVSGGGMAPFSFNSSSTPPLTTITVKYSDAQPIALSNGTLVYWLSGSACTSPASLGTVGTVGMPSDAVQPSARYSSAMWTGALDGHLYLYGLLRMI
jgi:hypothetical protein